MAILRVLMLKKEMIRPKRELPLTVPHYISGLAIRLASECRCGLAFFYGFTISSPL